MNEEILDINEHQFDAREIIPVSNGTRFANYLIDIVIFYVIFIIALVPIMMSGEGGIINTIAENPILDRIFSLICYAIFMTIQEVALGGRSIGKFITGTRVVDWEGKTPTTGTLVQRNLYRAVPFDQLSFLGSRGWHDSWSDTYVVKN
jgi:uncharacterized RDD family membrane protein YckC